MAGPTGAGRAADTSGQSAGGAAGLIRTVPRRLVFVRNRVSSIVRCRVATIGLGLRNADHCIALPIVGLGIANERLWDAASLLTFRWALSGH